MAGDWLKIEMCTPDKPEVIGIADILGIPPAHSFGALFLVWRWFDQHTTSGNASYVTKVTIDRLSCVTGFADAMVKVKWLCVDDDGIVTLPHFDRHNGETAKQRGLTAKRVAKSKAKTNAEGNSIGNAQVTDDALPREEKRRKENIYKQPVSKTPKKQSQTSIGENFAISDAVQNWADENGHSSLDERLAHFVMTCQAKGYQYVDWDAAFRKAITDDWAKLGKPVAAKPLSRDDFMKRHSA